MSAEVRKAKTEGVQKKQGKHENKIALLLLIGVLLAVWIVFGIVWRLATRVPAPEISSSVAVIEGSKQVTRRLLDGVAVASSIEIAPSIVAVIVDHNHDSYPISGIDKASVVYEAPAEGGITRLLALFPADVKVDEVGPVRSARPYFIDWAAEYGAVFVHVGGSPAAIAELQGRNDIINLDQYYVDKYSWRDLRRFAPHNTYTSSELWREALADHEMTTSSMFFTPWKFEDKIDEGVWGLNQKSKIRNLKLKQSVIRIPSTHDAYTTQWVFRDGVYTRLFGNGEYHMRGGSTVHADTIIVQQTETKVLDAEGRLDLQTTGQGSAWFFRDGMTRSGMWKRNKKTKRTLWYDATGQEIKLKPGKIWIHVVPAGFEPGIKEN